MNLSSIPADFRLIENFARTALARAGVDRSYAKVFAIGFNKTGTSSIAALCNQLGILARHTTTWNEKGRWAELWFHQAFADGSPTGFERLDKHFPNSRFILNVRNLDEWLDSRIEHLRHQQDRGVAVAGENWEISDKATCHWITHRNAHHLRVLEYFAGRPQDLLVVNYVRDPDAAAKLAAFLGRPAPAGKPHKYPTAVRREHGKIRNADMIARCMATLNLPAAEGQNDLYCPSLETAERRNKWPADTSGLALHPLVSKA